MNLTKWIAVVACAGLFTGTVFAQDPLLGKGKGGGGGGRGGGSSSGGGGGQRGGGGGSSSGGQRGGGGGSSSGGQRGGGGGQRGDGGGQRGGGDGGRNSGGGRGDRDDHDRDNGSTVFPGGVVVENGRGGGDYQIAPGVIFQKRGNSRSGRVNYGTVNNFGSRGRLDRPVNIRRPDHWDFRSGNLRNQIRREDSIQIITNGFRVGYYSYDSRWCDNNFYYPFYSWSPWSNACVVSPWYYYPQLPPYINCQRVSFANFNRNIFVRGFNYEYNNPDYFNRNDELDQAISDIQQAFGRRDRRLIDDLVPRRGQIHIYFDDDYAYSLDPNDFYDLLVDAVEGTYTVDYRILDVSIWNGDATVKARHDYIDPWGRRVSAYHTFLIEEERGYAVIRAFGTSDRP